ncbi:transducin/WD-40 repeat family protein [Thecamonas trahens ATCC 50062]|uniref:Transducin/WD-40 repeat family protein n=1 Tax=Thecamonas trahens ATCC 50062 TaxID=461836 RepID=A0A0L0DU41_THETB|nr:transducin/WD-40 repeat family protein [Thecamonas trahens ATCC 50062]KNC55775.1 transducin/WD-40 repeat family protein [Thecamonas trahens ATCC 50062]|eukprot:XP_013752857.1 transducin/WD-40 repeat family protein [Thecamonas trahens ATCC 50062]
MSKLTWQSAHLGPHSDIVFHPTGEAVVSAGSDGFVRVFAPPTAAAATVEKESKNSDITALAMSPDGSLVATGATDKKVTIWSWPEIKFQSFAARFTASISALAFSPCGLFLAVAAAESTVKIVPVGDMSSANCLRNHAGPVRALAWSPDSKLLATVADDGAVQVWDVEAKSVVTSMDLLPATNSSSHGSKEEQAASPATLGRGGIAFSPDGTLLAVSGESSLRLYHTATWTLAKTLDRAHKDSLVSFVRFSPNGLYLLSASYSPAGNSTSVAVWDVNLGEAIDVRAIEKGKAVIGAQWSPVDATVALINETGERTLWLDPVPSHLPHPVTRPGSGAGKSAAAAPAVAPAAMADSGLADFSTVSDTAVIARPAEISAELEKNTVAVGSRLRRKVVLDDSESGDDDDDDDAAGSGDGESGRSLRDRAPAQTSSVLSKLFAMTEGGDSSSSDDEDEAQAQAGAGTLAGEASGRMAMDVVPSSTTSAVVTVPHQAAIQPGSTPEDEKRRFLCYNFTGWIVARNEGTYNDIQIDFADTTKHKRIRVTDHHFFRLGTLNELGAFFASRADAAGDIPAVLSYRPFSSWTTDSEWFVQLPAGEDPVAIGIGHKWAAAATSANLLRIFSYAGLPLGVLALAGAPIAVAGAGDALAVVYAAASGSLRYTVYSVETASATDGGDLPLSPGSTLTWIGFSDIGELVTTDSAGVIRARTSAWGSAWLPIGSLVVAPAADDESVGKGKSKSKSRRRKRKSVSFGPVAADSLWMVGILESAAMVVRCKGAAEYPPTLPPPLLERRELKMPVVAASGAVGLESARLLAETTLVAVSDLLASPRAGYLGLSVVELEARAANRTADVDKNTLRLFRQELLAGHRLRALDLFTRLRERTAANMALALAQKHNMPALADRMAVALTTKFAPKPAAAPRFAPQRATFQKPKPRKRASSAADPNLSPIKALKTINGARGAAASGDGDDDDDDDGPTQGYRPPLTPAH